MCLSMFFIICIELLIFSHYSSQLVKFLSRTKLCHVLPQILGPVSTRKKKNSSRIGMYGNFLPFEIFDMREYELSYVVVGKFHPDDQ
jgi:hypothetical protein